MRLAWPGRKWEPGPPRAPLFDRRVATSETVSDGMPEEMPARLIQGDVRALLDRIVSCAAPPGGLVVDLFGGSGTTGESAHALGRRFVLGDDSPLAVATARARLLRAGVPLVVQRCGAVSAPEGEASRASLRRGDGRVCVELGAQCEPLAWAIDVAFDPAFPFRTAWHSERVPGARALPVARAATFDEAPGPIAVRVWYDDGSVATCLAEER
jgi:hypothetical protein